MLKNLDGSTYALESIEEIIENRCQLENYPHLSDALGSDWAAHMENSFPENPEHYKQAALDVAATQYKYSWE